jgi:hypothetical protein
MRTKYESKKDLQLEQKTLGYVSDCWNVAYFKLPISYKLDYSMYRNGVLVGWAEVKCRNHNFGTFPTYIISLGKVMEARKLSDFSNVKSVLIVSWLDALAYLDFSQPFTIKQGGRKDRGDWQDQEPMCHFDLKNFKIVGRK